MAKVPFLILAALVPLLSSSCTTVPTKDIVIEAERVSLFMCRYTPKINDESQIWTAIHVPEKIVIEYDVSLDDDWPVRPKQRDRDYSGPECVST